MNRCAWVLVAAGCGSLLGCKSPELNRDDLLPAAASDAPATMPTYNQIVERYNARLVGIDALSSRTQVEAVWRNEAGKLRSESGKGRLIIRRPLDTAVTIEALGRTVLWAGSNERAYWLFSDLHQGGEVVYGRFGGTSSAGLPMPVSPSLIPVLLGLSPLPRPAGDGGAEPVESLRGYALIEPPGLGLRMLLDVATASPVRVDLLDATGNSVVVCRLEGMQEIPRPQRDGIFVEGGTAVVPNVGDTDGSAGKVMPVASMPEGPMVLPRSVTIYPVHDESRLTLELTGVSLSDANIKPQWFEFDTLLGYLKPERVVDLDAR